MPNYSFTKSAFLTVVFEINSDATYNEVFFFEEHLLKTCDKVKQILKEGRVEQPHNVFVETQKTADDGGKLKLDLCLTVEAFESYGTSPVAENFLNIVRHKLKNSQITQPLLTEKLSSIQEWLSDKTSHHDLFSNSEWELDHAFAFSKIHYFLPVEKTP